MRSLKKSLPAFLGLRPAMFLFTLGLLPSLLAEAPLRALLICGGCCHDYEKQSVILRDGIQARANVQVDVIRSTDGSTKPWFPMYQDPDWAKGYDVVIHDECAAEITDMPYVQNIVDAHRKGVPAVNLHCAMHCYRTGTDLWFSYLGLQSSGHGAQRPIALDFGGANHPITIGMVNWTTIGEELYNNIKVFPTAKPLILGTQGQDASVVAWTNDYYGTRIFSTTLGHNNETVADERYMNLVVRGLLWSCDKLNKNYLTPYKGPQGHFDVISATRPDDSLGKPPENATLVTATASSTQDNNLPGKAIDGKLDSRWCASNASFPQWFQMEFEKAVPLTGLKIVWESGDRHYAAKIEGSADGQQWTTLADLTQNPPAGDASITFPQADLKFVKITCTGSEPGSWASIREISAIGEGVGPLFPKVAVAEKQDQDAIYAKRGNIRPQITQLTPEELQDILKDVKVPDGFDVTVFADWKAANYPVYVAAAPNGDLYVSSDGNGSLGRNPGRGRILRLRDTDGDGHADEVREFVKNVDSPRGLVWDHDRLYVIHPPDISCYIDHDGTGQADEEKTLIKGIAFGFKDRPADHTTNGLTMGIDGWLYIAGGDFGFMDAVGTDGKHLQHRGGGVIRFRPDGSGLELFADGTRNILGTPISPILDIFARDNTNDGGGWDVRFHHFTGLEDHGYPRLYQNFKDENIQPLNDYGGGSGCGAVYLSEPGFPDQWNNAPLTCDWGTGALWRHTVVPQGVSFRETGPPQALVKLTRPTGPSIDGLSHIYQASWRGPATFDWAGPQNGYIVRVTPKGYTPEPLPDFEKATDAALVALLEFPSQVRVLAAQRALLRRPGNAAMKADLLAMAGDRAKPMPARVAALYAITQRATVAAGAAGIIRDVTPLAADPDFLRFVLRALSDSGLDQFAAGKATAPPALYTAGLKSPDARTRLEAIVGATRQNMAALAPQIATQLGDADPVLAHTAYRALAMLQAADACFAVVDSASATPAQRTGALRALMRIHSPEVVRGLIVRLKKEKDPAAHEGLVAALCRLYFHEGEWKGDSWGTRPDTRGPYYQPEAWSETPKIVEALKSEMETVAPASAPALIRELKRNRIELGGSLMSITQMVKNHPELIPDLVSQLATAEDVPADAVPYLIQATQGDFPPATIAGAITILSNKTDSQDGCLAALTALGKLQSVPDAAKDYRSARDAFLAAPKLENHHQLLETVAAKLSGPASLWADAGLLALSNRKTGSPESIQQSRDALDQGWKNPRRQVQILTAIRTTGFHGLDDQVRLALQSPDATVAGAARETATTLKLVRTEEDKTPQVSTLKPEEVVEAVLKAKGDPALGEQLFTRQSCITCHTTRLDQVQKGPYLGTIAQTYGRADLATNILDPGKTIAQGFATELVTLKDGTAQMVFITLESAAEVKARNITGEEFTWKTADIAKRDKLPTSMMPPGLVNNLTVYEFASLLDYLDSLSKK